MYIYDFLKLTIFVSYDMTMGYGQGRNHVYGWGDECPPKDF